MVVKGFKDHKDEQFVQFDNQLHIQEVCPSNQLTVVDKLVDVNLYIYMFLVCV